ncbi:spermidine synthase [Streptomyces laurentii]|uniref:Polyamine aminopropyltransferase n=1 Tax=Streptomyces laurentii TaxID=39478 RepID=A0A160P1N1_STRLU|nr:spermidine synthase [Streptomyces laurentii]
MIDPPVTLSTLPRPPRQAVRPPVRPGAVRYPVLAVVFVCSACGLVYELELVALASYLIGDSVTQASVVLSVMVFAMGIGSLLAKRLRCRAAVGFGMLEAGLALVGGGSAMALYAAFAWLGPSQYVLVAFSLAIGVLIGAEIPLLMSLIQRAETVRSRGAGAEGSLAAPLGMPGGRRGRRRRTGRGWPLTPRARARRGARPPKDPYDAAGTVADLFAADYVGALAGGLAFPFLLLPWLGQLTGALVTGAVNALAGGGLVLWLFRHDLTPRARKLLIGANVFVLALLGTATVLADPFEQAARRAVYGDRILVAVRTDFQEVVVTGRRGSPPDLFLDGRLWADGRDEYRYHEALVHPAMNGRHARVLILGGGDGLAAREVLRYPDVRSVTVVERDPGVVRLARTDPDLAALNGRAFRDRRVTVAYEDAFRRLRAGGGTGDGGGGARYDVVICDLPDPTTTDGTTLYSEEFYGLAAGVLADGGRLVTHAGPAVARPGTYWTVDASLRAAGFATRPYDMDTGTGTGDGDGTETGTGTGPRTTARAGTASGSGPAKDWGFLLAAYGGRAPGLGLAAVVPRPRSLSPAVLATAASRAERTRARAPRRLSPSTLVHPRY